MDAGAPWGERMSAMLISSDSHVVEPGDLWTERMSGAGGVPRELIPRLVVGPEADEIYVGDIAIGATFRGGSAAGKRFESLEGMRLHGRTGDVRPGAYDPHARVFDMDADGVEAEVVYPTTALHMYHKIHDAALLGAILAVYNDWIADFCEAYPHRLRGLAMIVLDDEIEAAAAELRRCAKLGLAGAIIPVYPTPGEFYDDPKYDPFWAEAEALGMPLSLHRATNRPGTFTAPKVSYDRAVLTAPDRVNAENWVRQTLCHLIFSGVLERFPGLRFVQLEHELGWIPFFMDRIDYVYRERPMMITHRFADGSVPTDYLHRNVYHSFQEDALGMRDRGIIGVDNLLWGSDYPHLESTFPRSREILDRVMAAASVDDRERMTRTNTAKLYGF